MSVCLCSIVRAVVLVPDSEFVRRREPLRVSSASASTSATSTLSAATGVVAKAGDNDNEVEADAADADDVDDEVNRKSVRDIDSGFHSPTSSEDDEQSTSRSTASIASPTATARVASLPTTLPATTATATASPRVPSSSSPSQFVGQLLVHADSTVAASVRCRWRSCLKIPDARLFLVVRLLPRCNRSSCRLRFGGFYAELVVDFHARFKTNRARALTSSRALRRSSPTTIRRKSSVWCDCCRFR